MMMLLWYGFIVACVIFLVVGFAIVLTGTNDQPCNAYRDFAVKDVPVRCVKELTQ